MEKKQQAAQSAPGEGAQLARLQALIDRSTATATASVAVSAACAGGQMSAAEFGESWRGAACSALSRSLRAARPRGRGKF